MASSKNLESLSLVLMSASLCRQLAGMRREAAWRSGIYKRQVEHSGAVQRHVVEAIHSSCGMSDIFPSICLDLQLCTSLCCVFSFCIYYLPLLVIHEWVSSSCLCEKWVLLMWRAPSGRSEMENLEGRRRGVGRGKKNETVCPKLEQKRCKIIEWRDRNWVGVSHSMKCYRHEWSPGEANKEGSNTWQ